MAGIAGGRLELSFAPDMRLFKLALSLEGTTLVRIVAARLLDVSLFGDCGRDGGVEEKASASIAGDVGDTCPNGSSANCKSS
jgi:hypothetical protein